MRRTLRSQAEAEPSEEAQPSSKRRKPSDDTANTSDVDSTPKRRGRQAKAAGKAKVEKPADDGHGSESDIDDDNEAEPTSSKSRIYQKGGRKSLRLSLVESEKDAHVTPARGSSRASAASAAADKAEMDVEVPSPSPEPPKRARGRPKRSSEAPPTPTPTHAPAVSPSSPSSDDEGDVFTSDAESESHQEPTSASLPPKKRGRVTKQAPLSEPIDPNTIGLTPTPKKRGRKRKRDALEDGTSEAEAASAAASSSAPKAEAPPKPKPPPTPSTPKPLATPSVSSVPSGASTPAPAPAKKPGVVMPPTPPPRNLDPNRHTVAVREAALFNSKLMIDRNKFSPYYLDPNTHAVQVVHSFVVKSPQHPPAPIKGYVPLNTNATVADMKTMVEALSGELELAKDGILGENTSYHPWTDQVLAYYRYNPIDESTLPAHLRTATSAPRAANTQAKRLKMQMEAQGSRGAIGKWPRQRNVCVECNNEQPEKRKTALVFCAKCNSCHHSGCLGLPVKTAKRIRTYMWRCNNCKLCELCNEAGDEEKLVLCDACDRGYHTYCLSPPLRDLPNGEWMCRDCFDDYRLTHGDKPVRKANRRVVDDDDMDDDDDYDSDGDYA